MAFVHLGIHSEYSVIDSVVRLDELIEAAVADQMPALALTDLSNVYAAIKFYTACRAKGIKPILGSDVYVHSKDQRVLLLASNNTGWRHLIELISRGYTEGLHLGVPIIQQDWIFERAEGLIVLLGQTSDVGTILTGNAPKAAAIPMQQWLNHFGNRAYLTATRLERPLENLYLENALNLAEQLNIPMVAHNDIRFLREDDFEAHETRVCIANGETLIEPNRPIIYSTQQYFKTQAQMAELFEDLPELLENSVQIAARCTVNLTLGDNYLPDFPVPDGLDTPRYFEKCAHEGLEQRLNVLYATPPSDWPERKQRYVDRLKFEVDTIIQMGFAGYFLIVMDFIQWAKQNGVPVGPGRGSGAGSVVAWSLNITDLDPLAYDLLFERFLNPERVSMPDFDIDFCVAGRDRVIDYVAQKYGREAVSQIITFGTLAAKAVVRDVVRAQGKSPGMGHRIAQLIPKTPGMTLKKALKEEAQLLDMVENDQHVDHDEIQEVWQMALKLEGLTRNVGTHAGGVLIAPGKITDFSAIYCDAEGSRVSQFDKDDVEKIGLVKFDFLGLRNLTVIENALQRINAKRAQQNEAPINLSTLPLNDKKAYKIFAEGNTTAVFQFESIGMKRMLLQAKPTKFEEIIAFVALYRPGPMDLIPDYIDRMQGMSFEYLHPLLEPILAPTYGIMVYQEQVMQAAQICAGYTLGNADLLRRAMGKKKLEEMVQQRANFVEGAAKQGIDAVKANEIFDYMEKFAGYGFNKSHAAAYALLSYHTAWLKAHYAAEFMAAVLSSEMQNTDVIVSLIDDCRANGLNILPPDVNSSEFRFLAADKTTILYGLGAIKGVGEAPVESIMQARQTGPFKHLFDFCARVDTKKANRRTIEALIYAGAFDGFGLERSVLMEQVNDALQAAEQARDNRERGMTDLFGEVTEHEPPAPKHVQPWTDEVRLQGEKNTLGLYLTGHPINIYLDELKHFAGTRLNNVVTTGRGKTVILAGLVHDIKTFNNRSLVVLDDGTARLEFSLPTERLKTYEHLLKPEQVVVVEAEIYERPNQPMPNARLNRAFSLNEIRRKRVTHIQLAVIHHQLPKITEYLPRLLAPFTEGNSVKIPLHLKVAHPYAHTTLQLGERWLVRPDDDLLRALRELLGQDGIQVIYQLRDRKAVQVA